MSDIVQQLREGVNVNMFPCAGLYIIRDSEIAKYQELLDKAAAEITHLRNRMSGLQTELDEARALRAALYAGRG